MMVCIKDTGVKGLDIDEWVLAGLFFCARGNFDYFGIRVFQSNSLVHGVYTSHLGTPFLYSKTKFLTHSIANKG